MKVLLMTIGFLMGSQAFSGEAAHEDLAVKSVKDYFLLTQVQSDLQDLVLKLNASDSVEDLALAESIDKTLLKSESTVMSFKDFAKLQFSSASVNVSIASLKFSLLKLVRSHIQSAQSQPEVGVMLQKISSDLDSIVVSSEEE